MEPTHLGPYRIAGTLGHGGMGSVYRAINEETGEEAAVKVLAASLSQQGDFRHRFEAEIEALKKLRHPNIVRLFGFGEHEGVLFYAMELIEGSSLEQQLADGRRFSWREVAQIGVQTCRALRHAHDRGVIHRDLKPANLLMTHEGAIKLSDFGIARLFGTPGLTAAGNVLGTVEFMAPEQADGRPVGPRTDLYSLGAVFFSLLTGIPPFRGPTPLKILEKQRSATPEPVRRYTPRVPAELEGIINELLAKDPDDRIVNASLLLRRLESMLHGLAHLPDEGVQEPDKGSPADPDSANGPRAPAAANRKPLDETKAAADADEAPDDASNDASHAPAALPGTVNGPVEAPDVIGETRATSAFASYAESDSPQGGASVVSPAGDATRVEETAPVDHFTPVSEEDLDRVEDDDRLHRPLISVQTWVLAVALIALGLTAWYLLRPLSEDQLYSKIRRLTADQKIASLLDAEPYIEEFLARFPRHPQTETFRGYQRRIDLYRLEREIHPLAGLGRLEGRDDRGGEGVRMIDRALREADEIGGDDPGRAIAVLEAILDLYRDKSESPPIDLRLQLVERRLEDLRRRLRTWREEDLNWLISRLEAAEELDRSEDPDDKEKAERIRRGVIVLYGDTLWAQEAVVKAREALAAKRNSP